jgi:hypothetical protein
MSKSRKSYSRSHRRAAKRTRKYRGGMMLETLEAARTALLPFLLYKAQRSYIPKKKGGKSTRRR